jgi:hypothetical protein
VKRVLLLAVLAAAVAAPTAGATNECRGLMICVPVAGPWVLAPTAESVEYSLTCPRRYIVAGLDAELSARGIDVGFVGSMGAPVNPGITTSRDAVFMGRLVRGKPSVSAFRPHIGCVPASGGGQRTPTAFQAYAPGKPIDRKVREIAAATNTKAAARCPKNERLLRATHAIGFYGELPPTAREARSVRVTQVVRNGLVTVTIRSKAKSAVVQLDLLCVAK